MAYCSSYSTNFSFSIKYCPQRWKAIQLSDSSVWKRFLRNFTCLRPSFYGYGSDGFLVSEFEMADYWGSGFSYWLTKGLIFSGYSTSSIQYRMELARKWKMNLAPGTMAFLLILNGKIWFK